MARGKAATFEMQRASILKSAADLFADKGYHAAAMSELARACGVSKPLLYHYYRDKDHILFDIADNYMDQLLAIIERVEARGLAPQAHIEALIARFLEEYEHSQSQHAVLVQDVKHLPEEQRNTVLRKQRLVVEAFAAVIEEIKPGLRKRSLDKAVTMILFGMINWTFTWLRSDGDLSYSDMAPIVTQIFLGGVTGLSAQSERKSSRKVAAEAALEKL